MPVVVNGFAAIALGTSFTHTPGVHYDTSLILHLLKVRESPEWKARLAKLDRRGFPEEEYVVDWVPVGKLFTIMWNDEMGEEYVRLLSEFNWHRAPEGDELPQGEMQVLVDKRLGAYRKQLLQELHIARRRLE